MRVFTLLEVIIFLVIVAILLWAADSAVESVRETARKQLRAQISGSLTTAPPPPLTAASPVVYTLVLNTAGTTKPIGPGSAFHSYLRVTVTFTLVGAGGAQFAGGGRSLTVRMNPNTGAGTASIEPLQDGSDRLQISYTISKPDGSAPLTVTDPVPVDFETTKP